MNKDDLLNLIYKEHPNVEVLYLAYSGSHLYQTNIETSDMDITGIFLNDLDSLLMQRRKDDIDLSTNKENTKNTKDDIDIKLISLHQWIKNLRRGEVNAIELMFSMFYIGNIIYKRPFFHDAITKRAKPSYHGKDKLTHRNIDSFKYYAINHARRNGLKSERYKTFATLCSMIEKNYSLKIPDENIRPKDKKLENDIKKKDKCGRFIDWHLELLNSLENVRVINEDGKRYLSVYGKKYQDTISIKKLESLFHKEKNMYGQDVLDNLGDVNWKHLSHSIRVLYEALEYLESGFITFPLTKEKAQRIKSIKLKQLPFQEIQLEFDILLKKIEDKTKEFVPMCFEHYLPGKWNGKYADEFFLKQIKNMFFHTYTHCTP